QLGRFLGPDAAGRALAAAFILEELHQIQRGSLYVVLVGEDHNRVRPHETAVFFKGSEVERDIGHRCGQDAAGRTARQVALELVAVLHAAAELVDQLAHGDAGRRQLDARILHATRNRKAAETFALAATL